MDGCHDRAAETITTREMDDVGVMKQMNVSDDTYTGL